MNCQYDRHTYFTSKLLQLLLLDYKFRSISIVGARGTNCSMAPELVSPIKVSSYFKQNFMNFVVKYFFIN